MLKQVIICLLMIPFASAVSSQGTQPKADPRIVKRKVKTEELQNINEVYYFNNKPYTGTSIDVFPDRSKMQEIEWVNGLLHGKKTEFFKGGVLVRAMITFREGKRNGPFIFYHSNGKISLRGKYVNDELDSTVNAFYENGNNKYIHNFNMGVQVGELVTFYKNGNVEQKVTLLNQKPHGKMMSYYEAGNLRLESYYKEGVRNGAYIKYHLTGLIAEESYYKNGIQDSVSRYWDNVFGTLMKEAHFKMGKKEGTWITYNDIGDTITVFNYKDDVLNGPYKKYFAGSEQVGDKGNGRGIGTDTSKFDPSKSQSVYEYALDEFGTYVDGKLDGEFKTGLYNRQAHAEGTYKMGVMVGEWKYYDEDDKLVLHEKYNDDGELIYQKPKLNR
jgi:antitoxin component YwqK of YwqJK toxin-antitoxin module